MVSAESLLASENRASVIWRETVLFTFRTLPEQVLREEDEGEMAKALFFYRLPSVESMKENLRRGIVFGGTYEVLLEAHKQWVDDVLLQPEWRTVPSHIRYFVRGSLSSHAFFSKDYVRSFFLSLPLRVIGTFCTNEESPRTFAMVNEWVEEKLFDVVFWLAEIIHTHMVSFCQRNRASNAYLEDAKQHIRILRVDKNEDEEDTEFPTETKERDDTEKGKENKRKKDGTPETEEEAVAREDGVDSSDSPCSETGADSGHEESGHEESGREDSDHEESGREDRESDDRAQPDELRHLQEQYEKFHMSKHEIDQMACLRHTVCFFLRVFARVCKASRDIDYFASLDHPFASLRWLLRIVKLWQTNVLTSLMLRMYAPMLLVALSEAWNQVCIFHLSQQNGSTSLSIYRSFFAEFVDVWADTSCEDIEERLRQHLVRSSNTKAPRTSGERTEGEWHFPAMEDASKRERFLLFFYFHYMTALASSTPKQKREIRTSICECLEKGTQAPFIDLSERLIQERRLSEEEVFLHNAHRGSLLYFAEHVRFLIRSANRMA
mmetsp:Transcript_18753/g.47458  ORF Transcript_18753/g.47458 Transcript_18753/m.47458 type:complete len:551 (+) Transcript_18753:1117-2769(+)